MYDRKSFVHAPPASKPRAEAVRLTRLGGGAPRALARAWNGDFDRAAWMDSAELDGKEGSWPGRAPSLAELGIREPPIAT
jgi:hypothetical protein